MKRIYITTSIPYVNAAPHIGHALELVQADVIARYYRLKGKSVVLQTGTDENAYTNVLAAEKKHIAPQAFVDENSAKFLKMSRSLNISFDTFIRTTDSLHTRGVYAFWKRLRTRDIYKKSYAGLYCTGCEDFYLERDLVQGRCPDHFTPPVEVKEENYFFRLSAYQETLAGLISDNIVRVVPAERKNEVLSFIRRGLLDISISRDSRRMAGWGIPVPGDEAQTIYVWIDALINYLSGQGFGSHRLWEQVWNEQTYKVHVIGKNVWKFHAVYWPALLLSARLPLPNEIVVHGFVTVEGQKISKSIGNVIDPIGYVKKYGADPVRYYLTKAIPSFTDGNCSQSMLENLYTSDLANGIGNVASRILALCEKACLPSISLKSISPPPPEGYTEAMDAYDFQKAVRSLMALCSHINRDIDRVQPWKFIKTDKAKSILNALRRWVHDLHRLGYWVQPFLPATGVRIMNCVKNSPRRPDAILFPRLE